MAKKKHSISTTLFLYSTISIAILLGSFALFLVLNELQRVKKDIEQKKNIFINGKKNTLKSHVSLTVDFINYEKTLFEKIDGDSIQKLQNAILEQIAKIRFSGNGYIFVVSYDGTTLMNDVNRDMIGKNQWDITDPNGVKIVQKERKAIENPEGDFIYYSWYKPNAKIPTPKISFVKGIPDWEWMVGTGIYLEDIDKIIFHEHEASKKILKRYIFVILSTFVFFILLLLIIAKYIANKTQESFTVFSDFFKAAAAKSTKIDLQKLFFYEFIDPAIAANELIENLNNAKDKLTDFNLELEQRVKERTSEIVQQKEEILAQNEEIRAQKEELETHRNHLEHLVEERTADLELAKEKAEESDRLKSAFLANMSHEIRTPMNAIMGFSTLIIDPLIDNKLKKEMVSHLITNSNSLLKLIEDIIDISKIESDQLTANIIKVNIHEVLADLYEEFADRCKFSENKAIELILDNDIRNEILEINTDVLRFKQIFTNLLDNAFKFTEKGKISFGYNKIIDNNKEFLKFYVKDTGIGLSKEQHELIFQRFTKVEINKQKLYRGTGLGLSICKSLTEILGGEIHVESEENMGATFTFTIPIDYSQVIKKTPQDKKDKSHEYSWKNKSILIAEDEESNFRYLSILLSNTGANIFHANNGQEAIDIVKNQHVDVILMDVKMPVMNGLEASRHIKALGKKIPIIAQTAFTFEFEEKSTLDSGCDAYIPKPIRGAKLLSLLDEFLDD